MYDIGTPSSDIRKMLAAAFIGEDIFYQSNTTYTIKHNENMLSII